MDRIKIQRLAIEGFRSFKLQSWEPGDLNLLIGPNAGGKSNLLKALEILSAAAKGSLDRQVLREGGMDAMVWDGKAERVELRVTTTPIPPCTDIEREAVTYRIALARLGKSSRYRIDLETLGNFHDVEAGRATEPALALVRTPHTAIAYSVDRQKFTGDRELLRDDETLLGATGGPFFSVNPSIGKFRESLAGWGIYQGFETHPGSNLRTAPIVEAAKRVEADGQNVIAVLHTLYTTDREFKLRVDEAMGAAFDAFEELVFAPDVEGRIQLRIRWRGLNRPQSSAGLSDGTLRFLALLAVLVNPSPPDLLAIDEPETGLHPRMIRIVAEHIREAALQTQVIVTTHSPDFLSALGAEGLTTTVVETEAGETRLRVVSGDELSRWVKEFSLGELFRSNDLEALA